MRRLKYVLMSLITVILIYGFTFIPHKVVNIIPTNVSKIEVFDGNNGKKTIIEDRFVIERIINNLNSVTFKKGKASFMYMGYSFRLQLFNSNGKISKELTINSAELIRYKGFFYEATNNKIDYDYLLNLLRKND